jgi:hypothetical protein
MDNRQTSLFPSLETQVQEIEKPIHNSLFDHKLLFERLPGRSMWSQARITRETIASLHSQVMNPDPLALGFHMVQPASGAAPALVRGLSAARPVAFLATKDVYKNHYTLLDFMERTYTDWGIITDGTTWTLLSRTVLSPAERCCTATLPPIMDAAGPDLQRFLLLFTPAAFGASAKKPGVADRLLAESERLRRDTAGRAAQAAETAMLAFCRGFIRAERAATGATPAGQGLLMILRHALLLCHRCIFLLYAEARGALPMHDARYQRQSLTQWLTTAAEPATRIKPGAAPRFTLWAGLESLFDRAWRGDKATGAPPLACEFMDPDAHPFLRHNRGDDYHIQQAAAALHNACCKHPAQFADCDASHLATALAPLADVRLAMAHAPMILAADGTATRWRPAKDVKWVQVIERIDPGQAFLEHIENPAVVRTAAEPETILRMVDTALNKNSGPLFDPLCGSGLALLRAAAVLARRSAAAEPGAAPALHKRRVAESLICGADPNAFLCELARLCLTMFCLDPDLTPPALLHRVRTGNALLAPHASDMDSQSAAPDREFQDQWQALARDALELPDMPSQSYGQARRRCDVSKRLAARTRELGSRANARIPGAAQTGNRAEHMHDPGDAHTPLHPETAFPDIFALGPHGFACITAAAPRTMGLNAKTRAWLCEETGASGPLVAADILARRLAPLAAPHARLAILTHQSFLRTRKAAALKEFLARPPAAWSMEHTTLQARRFAVLVLSNQNE